MNRIYWIDHLKALGIVLVVLGHTSISEEVLKWIYSFHMPLFFLLTGITLTSKSFETTFSSFIKRRIIKLIYLYTIFSIAGIIHLFIIRIVTGYTAGKTLTEIILSYLYASGSIAAPLDVYPIVLWFFSAMISGLIVCYGIMQIPSAYRPPAAIAAILLGFFLADYSLPWEFETGLCAAFLIYLGTFVSTYIHRQFSAVRSILIAATLLTIGGFFAFLNSGFDFRTSYFGNPILSLLSFLLTVSGLYFLARNLPRFRLTDRIAEAAIIIFPLHSICFWFLDGIAQKFTSTQILYDQSYSTLKSIVTICFLTLIAPNLLRLLDIGYLFFKKNIQNYPRH